MAKILIVVESPKKGREIQKYLGSDYLVLASAGHIADLISDAKNKLGVDIDNDFQPHYVLIPEKREKVNLIIDAASTAKAIFIASDPDREGEAIAFHIAEAIKKKAKGPIKRVMFNTINKQGIQDGINNPLELNQNLYDAQQARRVLDRLVGFMVSPFVSTKLNSKLSAGRVQSVALRMIVDREREIESFVPDEYWSIGSNLGKGGKDPFFAKIMEPRITNKKDADDIKKKLTESTYKVTNVVKEEKPKKPQPPLETATLQQFANRKFGLSSAQTMKIAQSLYESGLVTYIRTDSTRSAPESIEEVRKWLRDHKFSIPSDPAIYSAKKNAQDAHEAIRPTNVNTGPNEVNLTGEEKKVYSLIWEQFVCSQMLPALYDTVAVTVKSSSGHVLKAHGRTLTSKGWLEIAGDTGEKSKDTVLPPLEIGDELSLVTPKVKAEQKFTQAPSRYTDESIVNELKVRGIGRPATYAATVQKITDRGYVEKDKKFFMASSLGKQVCDVLVSNFEFMQYQYTADMEDKLDLIAEGQDTYVGMMKNFFPHFRQELRKAHQGCQTDFGFRCPKCASVMWLKHGRFGYFLFCSDEDSCKTTQSCEMVDGKPQLTDVHPIQRTIPGTSCPKCSREMYVRDGKFGKFYSCSYFPKCNGNAKIASGVNCDKCGSSTNLTLYKGEEKLVCMAYPHCHNAMDIPKGFVSQWKDPRDIDAPEKTPAVRKVLKTKI